MILRSLIVTALVTILGVAESGFNLGAQASASDSNCEVFYHSRSFSIEACRISATRTAVSVSWTDAKTVNAEFNLRDGDTRGLFWDRLWFSKGENYLTRNEQDHLREALAAWGPSPALPPSSSDSFSRTRSFVQFLAEFLEPETRVEAFDRGVAKTPFLKSFLAAWTPICDLIGTLQTALFTANNETFEAELMVGIPESNCRGRCGWGCEPWLQWNKRQYTRECLNHDACHDIVGTQLGECKDEFWAAAASYALASSCL